MVRPFLKSANFGILGLFEEWSYLDFCFLQLLSHYVYLVYCINSACATSIGLASCQQERRRGQLQNVPMRHCSSPRPSPARHSSRGFCVHQTIEYGELLSNSATRTQQIVLIFQRTQTDCLFKPLQLDAFIFILSRNKRQIFNKHQAGSCCQVPLLPTPGLQNCRDLWQLGDIQITSSFLYILNPWPELLIF